MATTFQYTVRDRSGKLVHGTLEADSQAAVVTRLKGMGYAPVRVTGEKAGMNREINLPGLGQQVKLKDLAVFSRQFATMINSGLSMLRALTILGEQTDNKELRRVLGEVRSDVETGSSLSAALAKHPKVFPPLMVNMTKAGEVGGFLDSVLVQVADNYEAEVKLRGKVKAAMTYPVVVLVMALMAVTVMLIFIVPVFAKMFADLGGDLPAPTRVLVFLSGVLRRFAPFLLVGLVALFAVWRRVRHRDQVRAVVDPAKLRAPVFGALFQKIALSRFARNLGTMIHSGVPILQSLDIVADTTGNVVVARAVRDVQESVRQGEEPVPAVGAPLGVPADGRADDGRRRGDGRHRRDARQDRRLLRPRGRGDRRCAHVTHRAAPHRRDGCLRRRHGHLAVPADVQHHQAHQVARGQVLGRLKLP
jgi:type IV pilus assembly protein PilC